MLDGDLIDFVQSEASARGCPWLARSSSDDL